MKSKKGLPIKIGSNVWIGTNSVFLPEITIEAGSIVTKSFPNNSIITGNHAKLIRIRT